MGNLLDASEIFRLSINYGRPREEMFMAYSYNYKGEFSARRFPIKGRSIIEVEGRLFNFKKRMKSEGVIKVIESSVRDNPWSVAKIEHLLAFGEAFPKEPAKEPIFALGSVAKIPSESRLRIPEEIKDPRYVPGLTVRGSRAYHYLYLPWYGVDWHNGARFLAIRKVSAP